MIILGLTGSIGMGKSTLAALMRNLKIPVHESDIAVHQLLERNAAAYIPVASAFPYFEFPQIYEKKSKALKRAELGKLIFSDEAKRLKLESILHPLVQQSQQEFLKRCRTKKCKFTCLDIPLLFETRAEERVNYTIVVTAPPFIQRTRVLSRPHMTQEKFYSIVSRQIPDKEKKIHADYIIHTGLGLAHSLKSLKLILKDIEKKEFSRSSSKLQLEPKGKNYDPRNRTGY